MERRIFELKRLPQTYELLAIADKVRLGIATVEKANRTEGKNPLSKKANAMLRVQQSLETFYAGVAQYAKGVGYEIADRQDVFRERLSQDDFILQLCREIYKLVRYSSAKSPLEQLYLRTKLDASISELSEATLNALRIPNE
jgi:hypothetical protein